MLGRGARWGHRRRDGAEEGGGTPPLHASAQVWRGGVSPPSSLPSSLTPPCLDEVRDGAIVGATALKRAAGRRPSTPARKFGGAASRRPLPCPLRSRHHAWTRCAMGPSSARRHSRGRRDAAPPR